MNLSFIFRGLLLIALLIGIAFVFKNTGLQSLLDTEWFNQHIRNQGFNGIALYITITAISTGLGFPRQILSFLGGYSFGVVLGSLLALLGTVTGCILAFYTSRYLAREQISRRYNQKILRIDDFLHNNTFRMTLLIRLVPVGSNLATNLIAGVTSARAVPFFGGSLLGLVPQTIEFALLGSGVNIDPQLRISLAVILFLVSCLLGLFLYRKYHLNRTIDRDNKC